MLAQCVVLAMVRIIRPYYGRTIRPYVNVCTAVLYDRTYGQLSYDSYLWLWLFNLSQDRHANDVHQARVRTWAKKCFNVLCELLPEWQPGDVEEHLG